MTLSSSLRTVVAVLTFVSMVIGAKGAAAHPVHATIAEVEWNQASGTYEVALQMQISDVERALHAARGANAPEKSVLFADDNKAALEILRMVDRDFFAEVGALGRGKRFEAKAIGAEIGPKVVWLFFTWRLEGQKADRIESRLFLTHSKTHINTVVVTERMLAKSNGDPADKAVRSHIFRRKAPGPWNVATAFSAPSARDKKPSGTNHSAAH